MRFALGLIILVVELTGFGASSFAQCNQVCPDKRTISVNGTGVVVADADLAIVRVGYKLYGADAKSAYAIATKTSNSIMNALTGAGIQKTAIESTSQVLQHTQQYEIQQFPSSSDEWRNRQFTVMQSWNIRVKPDEAAGALNTAIDSGANESGWIEWIVQNPSVPQAEASAKAVADARMVAEQIAQKGKVQLGQLLNVTENQGGPINGLGVIAGLGSAIGMGSGFADRFQSGNQQLVVNSRRVEFSVSVFAVFAIE